jgi:flagellar biosynthesis protein FlhG
MYKGKDIKDIITKGPLDIGFISGGSGIAKLVNLDREQIKRLVNKMSDLESMCDIIIIDTGAGIADSVMEFLVASPETIVVTTPEPTSITDSYALLKSLSMHSQFRPKDCKIKMIANKVESEKEGEMLHEKLNLVVSKFLGIDIEYLGIIPQDSNVTKAVMKQSPVSINYPNSPSTKAFENISNKLLDVEGDVAVYKRGIRGYLKNVFAKML